MSLAFLARSNCLNALWGFALALMATQLVAQQDDWPEPEGPLSQHLCMTCHGAFGQGSPIVGGPNLAGMEPWYLRRQLHNFVSGLRGSRGDDVSGLEMREAVARLSAEELDRVIAEVGSWPPIDPPATLGGNAARGAELYSTMCGACHGGAGEGNEQLDAPALAARSDWYLLRQLQLFESGKRGAHPEDTAGARMRAAMQGLADEADLHDVLAYIATL